MRRFHKFGFPLSWLLYSTFALGDYDIMNNFIKFSWDSGETRTLIDGQTAYGFTKPLSHEDFINKNLIPWIEPKPDILDKGAELLVQ